MKRGSDVDIQTFEGTAVDFARTVQNRPSQWYYLSHWDARRQETSQWNQMIANPEENYGSTWDETTQVSSQACTAKRYLETPNNYIEIKYGTAYTVRTGYYIYLSSDEDKPIQQGTAENIEVVWDSATTLVASLVAAVLTILL